MCVCVFTLSAKIPKIHSNVYTNSDFNLRILTLNRIFQNSDFRIFQKLNSEFIVLTLITEF